MSFSKAGLADPKTKRKAGSAPRLSKSTVLVLGQFQVVRCKGDALHGLRIHVLSYYRCLTSPR